MIIETTEIVVPDEHNTAIPVGSLHDGVDLHYGFILALADALASSRTFSCDATQPVGKRTLEPRIIGVQAAFRVAPKVRLPSSVPVL